MEPDQVDVPTAAVFRDLKEILHVRESGLLREIVGDVGETNPFDRIHDNLSIAHSIAAAWLDVGVRPDADAARDPSASNSFAQLFRELHATQIMLVLQKEKGGDLSIAAPAVPLG